MSIDYDDYLDVLFLYWVEDLSAYEHHDLFYILGVIQLHIIYICVCVCVCVCLFVLGMDPEAHD